MKEALRDSARKLMEVQFAAGARSVYLSHAKRVEYTTPAQIGALDRVSFEPGHVGAYSAHVMGGCAMGKDSKTSVVDAETLRYHDLDNLHVVDGSVLPTAATVNPQMTIYGLASWAADLLRSA